MSENSQQHFLTLLRDGFGHLCPVLLHCQDVSFSLYTPGQYYVLLWLMVRNSLLPPGGLAGLCASFQPFSRHVRESEIYIFLIKYLWTWKIEPCRNYYNFIELHVKLVQRQRPPAASRGVWRVLLGVFFSIWFLLWCFYFSVYVFIFIM